MANCNTSSDGSSGTLLMVRRRTIQGKCKRKTVLDRFEREIGKDVTPVIEMALGGDRRSAGRA